MNTPSLNTDNYFKYKSNATRCEYQFFDLIRDYRNSFVRLTQIKIYYEEKNI